MATHKILVIDDSKVIRMRVRDMLPEGNFQIIEAKDGLQGLENIRSEHPNLIMLDFLLPKMSGWEVYQEIQQDDHLKTIPLVVMSGRKEEVVEKIAEPFEYFAFIEKPFDQNQMGAAIREAMKKAKKRAKPAPVAQSTPSSPAIPDQSAMQQEIESLKGKVTTLENEVTLLKKQLAQLVGFIKKKILKTHPES